MKFAIHAAFTAVFSVNLFIELNRSDLSSEECIHTFHTHTRTRHLLEMLWLLKSQCLRLHGQKLWFLFMYNFCHNCQRFMKMFKTLFTSLSLLSQIVLMYLWRSAFYVFVALSILCICDAQHSMYLWRSAFFSHSSLRKVSRKPKILNRMWFYCCFYLH